ncbi:hypothetical protein HQ590_10390, partial [bacterium]|nr:hypothetical protein [bacterium]
MSEPPPGEFYTGLGGVDLSKLAGPGPGGQTSPVWRLKIAVSDPDPANEPDPDDAVAERCVYFVDLMGATVPADGNVQYYPSAAASGAVPPVAPGGYTVIGSGDSQKGTPLEQATTYVGFQVGDQAAQQLLGTTRRLVLDPGPPGRLPVQNDADVQPEAGSPPAPLVPMPGFVVVDSVRDPTGNPGDPGLPRRMSVSEPAGGYPNTLAGGTYNAVSERYEVGGAPVVADEPLDSLLNPGEWPKLAQDITTTRHRIIHLQRLANPLQPYDDVTNPYRTIDSMGVDLTAFNGVSAALPAPLPPGGPIGFDSCQRGERNDDRDLNNAPNNYLDFNLWKQEPQRLAISEASPNLAVAGHYFSYRLRHSLGYLINDYGYPGPRTTATVPPAPGYEGDPQMPFPWLTWLNRPFTNPLELLLVPTLRSSTLLSNDTFKNPADLTLFYHSYRILRRPDRDPNPNPYDPDPGGVLAPSLVPYPHVLNFFQSVESSDPNPYNSPQFHRLLEYVRVPSPFVGTEVQCNPAAMVGVPGHPFHPPFHGISTYREPGRINLNTLFSEEVFRGLLNRPDMTDGQGGALWEKYYHSRRGYGAMGDGMLTPHPAYPTFFANPFRSAAGMYLVPLDPLRTLIDREVNSTLLRADPDDPSKSLFEAPLPVPGNPAAQWAGNNIDRNPFFRYLPLTRLGNLVTT